MAGAFHVAFLRGINVGGKHKLPMKDLAAMFVGAGCKDVATFIQSGNVICSAGSTLARNLPAAVEAAILKRFGYRVPVVLRTAAELREVVAANPFAKAGLDADKFHVGFLADEPGAARQAALDPHRSPPDEFAVRGKHVYFLFPNGVGRTKLTNAYFDAKLGTIMTLRNWRTVRALVGLIDAGEP